ncbi:hypothetical protein [Hymenobacter sp. B81]|uniref:hypothetical protein n=1 Tax=Hymenobacter sp. B81 TaxID=3344878 RepID=UPI0037DD13B3
MKHVRLLLGLGLLLSASAAWAQAGLNTQDLQDIARERPFSAKSLNESQRREEAAGLLYLHPDWQPGRLFTAAGQWQPATALRYNVSLRILEMRDSTGAARLLPVGSLRGFALGQGAAAREFRTRRCRLNGRGLVREFVEVLSVPEQALLLGVVHEVVDEPAVVNAALNVTTRPARRYVAQTLVAGPGRQPEQLLLPLTLEQRSVLRLFGARAPELAAYAQAQQLRYDRLPDVLRLVERYNIDQ